ncbi:MAG: hypothetical protein LYZ70_00315 [Nitrososphaerales archaeon]|nr:hypothetical protein [Nitrososphaerales archaeon]
MTANTGVDSSWQDETKNDLRHARDNLESLVSSIAGELTGEQLRTLWEAYLLVEKSVVFVKVELDEENPGRFINSKHYVVPDERQAVGFALRNLRESIERFEAGHLAASLKALREARNYLRTLLKRKRRERLRKVRA